MSDANDNEQDSIPVAKQTKTKAKADQKKQIRDPVATRTTTTFNVAPHEQNQLSTVRRSILVNNNPVEQIPGPVITQSTAISNVAPDEPTRQRLVRKSSTIVNAAPDEHNRSSVVGPTIPANDDPVARPNWIDRIKKRITDVDIGILFSSKKSIVFLLILLLTLF
jgi:hypothetical protein